MIIFLSYILVAVLFFIIGGYTFTWLLARAYRENREEVIKELDKFIE